MGLLERLNSGSSKGCQIGGCLPKERKEVRKKERKKIGICLPEKKKKKKCFWLYARKRKEKRLMKRLVKKIGEQIGGKKRRKKIVGCLPAAGLSCLRTHGDSHLLAE